MFSVICNDTIDDFFFVFFFQAEDGIRDGHVTGVQTCALPILDEEDSLLHDGEGNPYLEHEISYPLVSAETLNGEYARFYFDPSIYLSNTDRDLMYMHITLSNGQNKIFFPDDFDSLFIGDINDSLITGTIDLHFSTLRDAISTDVTWFNGN